MQATTPQPNRQISLPVHLFACATFLALTALLVLLFYVYRDTDVWAPFRASGGLEKSNYAERIYRASILRTRANTWSNLAYILVGLYAIGLAWQDHSRRGPIHGYLRRTPALSVLFGLGCCFLGLGSGIFHASLTRWGQQLDVASMYAPLLALLAINTGRYLPRLGQTGPPTWPATALLATLITALLYHYKWQMSSFQVLSTLLLLVGFYWILDLLLRPPVKIRWAAFSALALVLAVVCRQTDVAGKFTGPDAWLQGHALWHVLTALCLACAYAYYRSETDGFRSPFIQGQAQAREMPAPQNEASH